jgi:hypothetical protein
MASSFDALYIRPLSRWSVRRGWDIGLPLMEANPWSRFQKAVPRNRMPVIVKTLFIDTASAHRFQYAPHTGVSSFRDDSTP